MKLAITFIVFTAFLSVSAFAQTKVKNMRQPAVGVATAGCQIGAPTKSASAYCETIEQQIQKQPGFAQLSKVAHKRGAVCSIEIAANGDVSELTVKTSSGSEEFDRQAVNLLKNAAPYERHHLWNMRLLVNLPELKATYARKE